MAIWNLDEVSRITQLSKECILENEKVGYFPQRKSERGWEHTDVERWLAELPTGEELVLEDMVVLLFEPRRKRYRVSAWFLLAILAQGIFIGFVIAMFILE